MSDNKDEPKRTDYEKSGEERFVATGKGIVILKPPDKKSTQQKSSKNK